MYSNFLPILICGRRSLIGVFSNFLRKIDLLLFKHRLKNSLRHQRQLIFLQESLAESPLSQVLLAQQPLEFQLQVYLPTVVLLSLLLRQNFSWRWNNFRFDWFNFFGNSGSKLVKSKDISKAVPTGASTLGGIEIGFQLSTF